jgi:hypothetical protein
MKRSKSPPSGTTPTNSPARKLTLAVAVVAAILAFLTLAATGILYISFRATMVNVPTVAMLPTGTPSPSPTLTATQTPTPSATRVPASPTPVIPTVTATSMPGLTETEMDMPTPTETILAVITATSGPAELPTSLPTQLPPPTDELAQGAEEAIPTAAAPNSCIALVGDSVTHGGVTYEIPATGYIVGLTNPLSLYVERALHEHGITDVQVYDRGASNTGISSTNHPSYFKTAAYRALRADHCKYTMIMPWLNDISPDLPPDVAAPRHVRALISLVQQLIADNPGGKVVVLDYFHGAVAPFAAQTWASGFTPESVEIYNHEIGQSCNLGTLNLLSQISCVNIDDAFEGMGDGYVIGMISHQELSASLIAPLNPIQAAWLDQYYAVSPDGLLQGDGVHLSIPGKMRLAEFLIMML